MHIRKWLSSLHQKEHSQHLCLQQQGPQWAQRHQSLPSPDGRRAGLALSKAGWGQAQNHSQRSTARLNQCRPAGMTDLQQGKATIRSWGLHTEPANDTNRRNLQKCWDFLVLWMRSGQPHQNHVRAARGISELHATIRVPERSRPAEARLRPPRTPSSGRLPSPP